ncbi:MAG: DUF4296 domain-containing protein [Chlorobi bacterium]|nr:DUF4296 domain-containing protein [Chlorobiota bacterium]
MRAVFYIGILLMLLVSCRGGRQEIPSDVLPPQRMAEVMADLLEAKELAVQRAGRVDTLDLNLEAMVWQTHGIDSAMFARSLRYYAARPDLMEVTYVRVVDILQARVDSLDKIRRAERPQDTLKPKIPPGFLSR